MIVLGADMSGMISPRHPPVHFHFPEHEGVDIYSSSQKEISYRKIYEDNLLLHTGVMKICKQVENIQDVVNKMYDVLQDYKLTEEGELLTSNDK